MLPSDVRGLVIMATLWSVLSQICYHCDLLPYYTSYYTHCAIDGGQTHDLTLLHGVLSWCALWQHEVHTIAYTCP